MVSSSLKLVKYLLSAHTNAWYVLNGGSYSEPFLELQDEPELGGHGSELYPVTSSMNLCSLKTACPYTAMCSRTECRQFCSTDEKKKTDYNWEKSYLSLQEKKKSRFLTYTGQMSDHYIVPY